MQLQVQLQGSGFLGIWRALHRKLGLEVETCHTGAREFHLEVASRPAHLDLQILQCAAKRGMGECVQLQGELSRGRRPGLRVVSRIFQPFPQAGDTGHGGERAGFHALFGRVGTQGLQTLDAPRE